MGLPLPSTREIGIFLSGIPLVKYLTIFHSDSFNISQEGIQPMWEDSKNRAGGRWLLNFDKSSRKTDLDNCWMETVRGEVQGEQRGGGWE